MSTTVDFSPLAWVHKAICVEDTEKLGQNLWLSEQPRHIRYATDRCLDCPVFFKCKEYAENLGHGRFGVLAGEWYDETNQQASRTP